MLPREGLSSEAVYEAFTRVLEDDRYRTAAAKLSKRIRSRKRTPLQEAAGERPGPQVHMLALLLKPPKKRNPNCKPQYSIVELKT